MWFETAFEGIGAGPVIAGAAALGILLGVAGGESIDTTPLQRGKSFDQLVPDAQPVSFYAMLETPNLPNHYPVETRNGRVEVWELRSYILRRERPAVFDPDALETGADEVELVSLDDAPTELGDDATAPPNAQQFEAETVPGNLEPTGVNYSQPYSSTSAL